MTKHISSRRVLFHPELRLYLPWTGSTWAINNDGRLFNTPTTPGAELLTDPGLEAWTSATNLTSYVETIGGTSTVNQETSVIHGGSNATRLDVDGSNTLVSVHQSVGSSIGTWYLYSIWSKAAAGSPTMAMNLVLDFAKTLSTTYTQFFASVRATGATIVVLFKRSNATGATLYFDDGSVKALTLNTLFASVDAGMSGLNVSVPVYLSHAQVGVVSHLDSQASPANFLIGYISGTNLILDKCVGGTYTNLVSVATTFVSGARPEIRRLPGSNIFQLWYRDKQVGADQTVSDAGIISNTRYGLFSTHQSNLLLPHLKLDNYLIPIDTFLA